MTKKKEIKTEEKARETIYPFNYVKGVLNGGCCPFCVVGPDAVNNTPMRYYCILNEGARGNTPCGTFHWSHCPLLGRQ